MSNINTGGPAFPFPSDCASGESGELGMTLRDYFAAKAMQGASANPDIMDWFKMHGEPGMQLRDWIAPAAYAMADAMLAARDAS